MNWDIYISTTNIGKVHKEIRAVAEFGYRHKNMASIFAFMKGRYKKVTHNAENSGTALSHEITSAIIKIDPRCFNAYNSTATGKVKDTESAKSVSPFSRPKVQIIFLLFLAIFAFLFSKLTGDSPLPPMFTGGSKPASGSPHASFNSSHHQAPVHVSPGVVSAGVDIKNPFEGLRFIHVGSINNTQLFQVVYADNSYISVDQDQLVQLGFNVALITTGIVKLTFEDHVIYALPKPKPNLNAATNEGATLVHETSDSGVL
jgi:zona occludens toxin